MKRKIAEGTTLGLKYQIFDNSGIVEKIEFRKDMLYNESREANCRVKMPEFAGGLHPVELQQDIRFVGAQGSVKLEDQEAVGNNGQQLSLFLLTHGRNQDETCFGFHNHSTQKSGDNSKTMYDQLFPWAGFWGVFGLAVAVLFTYLISQPENSFSHAFFITGFGIPLVFMPIYLLSWWIGLARTISVRKNSDFRAYAEQLRQQLNVEIAQAKAA